VERIVVLNLTAPSKGNACGIGVADVTTKKFVDSMDLDYTYVNAITSGILATARIPLYMANDREAIHLALKTCARVQHPESRIVWIKNTLSLEGKALGLGFEDRNLGKSGRFLPLSKDKKIESPLITPNFLILYLGTDFAIEITKL